MPAVPKQKAEAKRTETVVVHDTVRVRMKKKKKGRRAVVLDVDSETKHSGQEMLKYNMKRIELDASRVRKRSRR